MSIYINLPSGVAKRALLLFSRHAFELALRDDGPDTLERLFHAVGGLRGRPDEVGVVRLAQEFLEPRLAHDVPDRQVHARVDVLLGHGDLQDLLRHLGAEGRLVAVLERVEDEPPDQRRLADGEVADEADLRLQDLGPHATRPRSDRSQHARTRSKYRRRDRTAK